MQPRTHCGSVCGPDDPSDVDNAMTSELSECFSLMNIDIVRAIAADDKPEKRNDPQTNVLMVHKDVHKDSSRLLDMYLARERSFDNSRGKD